MGFQSVGCENIWLAWDGEDQAVLGYFALRGEELVKHRKSAAVLCHLKPSAFNEGNRSGVIIDAFEINPGDNFLRTLKLPRDVHTIELLIEAEHSAQPLKTFKLVHDADELRPGARYGNVVIALPEDDDGDTDGRFVWSDKRVHHLKTPSAHIGWAGYFVCWPVEGKDAPDNIVMVSSFHLEVPHLEDALQIYPVGYDIIEAEETAQDDEATAIVKACIENERIQNAVLTIEGSPPLLYGLYFLHVSAHRQRANEWSRIVDIDPGVFQLISDNLVEAYRQQLEGSGDWNQTEIEDAGQNLIEILTQEHRWFELTSPDNFVDVVPQETDEKAIMSVFEISAGDHLVFYDTMGRKLRVGQHISSDNILAFEATTTGLQLLRGVYTTGHKKIAEIDAHRPAKRSSAADASKIDTLPASLRSKHDEVGAPYTPFDFLPLKVCAAIQNSLNTDDIELPWTTFIRDPAPWFMANLIKPNFWESMVDFKQPREGSILVRALSLLGREDAFVNLPQLEDQILASFVVISLAKTDILETCVFRINGLSPARDDLYALAESIDFIDGRLNDNEFRDWLFVSQPQLYEALLETNGTLRAIDQGSLDNFHEEMVYAAQIFDDFHGELLDPGDKSYEVINEGKRWQSLGTSEEALEGLIASLKDSNLARDEVAGRRYEALLVKFGRNAYYRSRIASDIYANYPELLPDDSKKLIEFLRGLLKESGCNFDARNFEEDLVDDVAENMQDVDPWLLPNAIAMRKTTQIELDNASMTMPTEDFKKAAIVEFAAAHEVQRTWDDISQLASRAEEVGIRIPTKLRRLQLLWPRESATTLSEYLAFEQKHKHVLGQELGKKYGYDPVMYA